MCTSLKELLQHKINTKTKPLGALGMLENIALQIGVIQETSSPSISNPTIVIFAGDHGIAATGLVNPYPQAVTAQMVLNFIEQGAAINVFTKLNNINLLVVDAGVNYDFSSSSFSDFFIDAKQGLGTKNYLDKNAMSLEEVSSSIEKGKLIVQVINARGCNCIGFGEMGIGNTSSASLIMSAITGISIEACIGRGTGVNDAQLNTKMNILKIVFDKYQLNLLKDEPFELLSTVGGFEIAMMTGAYISAYQEKSIIIVDGFIATAALLIALKIEPLIINNCLFAHTSGEQGHEKILQYLDVQPILNLGLRLGEGTGAALAMPIVQSAVAFLNEMASFEQAGVSSL